MAFFSGTSGYSYPAWKGHFYPAGTRENQMLDYYMQHLDSTELNHTFYRAPAPGQLAALSVKARPGFRFAVKAPQIITHRRRLKETEELVGALVDTAVELGGALGPLLFQLPPNMKADGPRLSAFLAAWTGLARGKTIQAAFEFRHESWLTDSTFDLLAEHGAALVAGDSDEGKVTAPLRVTAPHAYVRLRRTEPYPEQELDAWAEKLGALDVSDIFVFFKHEIQGPAQAQALARKVRSLR